MSTALYGFSKAWAPLQGLLRWAMPSPSSYERTHVGEQKSPQQFSINPVTTSSFHQEAKFQKQCSAASTRPLRVVRILEADHTPANVGRMMISGRMADVCAELDRLAAREIAIH